MSSKKKPRSSRRYAYVCQAQATVGNELDEAQLTNISASGIQFRTHNQIKLNMQIQLLWNDPELGIMSVKMYVVREVVDAEDNPLKYVYGAQYHKLDKDLKSKLITLLKRQHELEAKETLEKIQEASPEYLLGIAKEGHAKLHHFLTQEEAKMPAILKAIHSLAEYEMKSFLKTNDYSSLIQKFAALTFQYRLLVYLTTVVMNHDDFKDAYFKTVNTSVKHFHEAESLVPSVSKKIKALEGPDYQKEGLVGRVQESMNRAFYAKQDLLQAIHESFENADTKVKQYNDSLRSITEEYEQSLEVSQRSLFDLSAWDVLKKVYKVEESVIIDNRPPPGTVVVSSATSIIVILAWIAIMILVFKR